MQIIRWIFAVVIFALFIFSWKFAEDELYPFFGDLRETVHTYVNFHKVKSDFDIAFKHNVDTMPNNASDPMVPKILHHIWLQEHGDGTLEKYDEAYSACTRLHKSKEG